MQPFYWQFIVCALLIVIWRVCFHFYPRVFQLSFFIVGYIQLGSFTALLLFCCVKI